MITSRTTKVYELDGREFASLAEAQKHALGSILQDDPDSGNVLAILNHADEIVDILTTRPGSLARARKAGSKEAPQLPYVKLRDSKAGVEKFLQSYPRNLNLEQTATMSDAVLLRCRGIGKVWLKRIRAVQPEVVQSSSPDKLDTMLAGLGHGLVPNVPSVLPMKGAQ